MKLPAFWIPPMNYIHGAHMLHMLKFGHVAAACPAAALGPIDFTSRSGRPRKRNNLPTFICNFFWKNIGKVRGAWSKMRSLGRTDPTLY